MNTFPSTGEKSVSRLKILLVFCLAIGIPFIPLGMRIYIDLTTVPNSFDNMLVFKSSGYLEFRDQILGDFQTPKSYGNLSISVDNRSVSIYSDGVLVELGHLIIPSNSFYPFYTYSVDYANQSMVILNNTNNKFKWWLFRIDPDSFKGIYHIPVFISNSTVPFCRSFAQIGYYDTLFSLNHSVIIEPVVVFDHSSASPPLTYEFFSYSHFKYVNNLTAERWIHITYNESGYLTDLLERYHFSWNSSYFSCSTLWERY